MKQPLRPFSLKPLLLPRLSHLHSPHFRFCFVLYCLLLSNFLLRHFPSVSLFSLLLALGLVLAVRKISKGG